MLGATQFDTATLTYDALGRVTTGLRPDWYHTQFVYHDVHRVKRAKDAVGQLRDYAFDPNRNLLSEGLTVNNVLVDQRTFAYDLSDARIARTPPSPPSSPPWPATSRPHPIPEPPRLARPRRDAKRAI